MIRLGSGAKALALVGTGVLLAVAGWVGTRVGGGEGGSGPSLVSPPPATPFLARHRVDLLFGDCSSFRAHTETYVPQMIRIATSSALAERELWIACFDGAPLRTLRWDPQVDFGDVARAYPGNGSLTRRVNVARALGLRRRIERMIATTPRRVRGSGQLEALEVAARTEDVGRVFMVTDAVIHQIDGVRLGHATDEDIDRTIARWRPRLTSLRRVQLIMIGVGLGTRQTRVVRKAERLFRGIARAIPVGRFVWSLELPADLQTGTDLSGP
jgi:hypothetical protein